MIAVHNPQPLDEREARITRALREFDPDAVVDFVNIILAVSRHFHFLLQDHFISCEVLAESDFELPLRIQLFTPIVQIK